MISGRFGDTTTAPYVEASVYFPRLKIRGYVSFLVDTGASGTVLMPADTKKLSVDFGTLRNPTVSHGIGGFSKGFNEQVVLGFTDRRHVYGYEIEIEVASPAGENELLPSLLGRDILDRWRLVIDHSNGHITFTPRSWDLRVRL